MHESNSESSAVQPCGDATILIYALQLTRHLWYSIMARALSIFFFSSARAATS